MNPDSVLGMGNEAPRRLCMETPRGEGAHGYPLASPAMGVREAEIGSSSVRRLARRGLWPRPRESMPDDGPSRWGTSSARIDGTRRAAARVRGRLKPGRRVATRYAPYAQRGLGFLHLADVGLWLKSKANAI